MEKNEEELMGKLIEKLSPRLLDAMSGKIAAKVEEQLGPFKKNSEKLLDQVQDAKRREKEQGEDFAQLKTLLERGDAPADIKDVLNPDPVVLTREQARDPQLYRRAKAEAEKNGTTVQIHDPA